MKLCAHCRVSKPPDEFYKSSDKLDGLNSYCKLCDSAKRSANHLLHKEKNNKVSKDRYRSRPEEYKDAFLKHRYGLTLEQYNEMLAKQQGLCAICQEPETAKKNGKIKSLSVDHCHKTGKVRGLLCHACNTGIGSFKEDLNLLNSVKHYLEESRSE